MLKFRQVLLVLVILLCVALGCSKSTKYSDNPLYSFNQDEAQTIALCLSGELVAPESLSNRVCIDLAVIRSAFGDEFKMIRGINFFPPWIEDCFILGFDDTTAKEVAEGEYHAWDQLNTQYQIWRIDTTNFYNHARLHFKGRLHPQRLAELYGVLPGVIYAEPIRFDGDFPNVYARQTSHGMTYLFCYAEGDCEAGCIYNEYWYFTFEGDRPVFVGHWIPSPNMQPPDWWEEAKLNREQSCN